ncbi:MAG: hypothetical protein ABJP02_07665 [Parasphingorhabdus sp.]|uniref:hypothetical protein n=1 Tax=Parasphingorhabdus sp. TaxID=2709688 RepID=UPI0032985627
MDDISCSLSGCYGHNASVRFGRKSGHYFFVNHLPLTMMRYRNYMSQINEIGSFEGRLCGNLAAALAKLCCRNGERGEKGSSVPSLDLGDFQNAQDALNDIGVMEEVARNSNYRVLAFSMDADAMPDFLAQKTETDDKRISILIEAFIGLACGYGDALLPDVRGWFHPPVQYVQSMKWFARTGYAERKESEFRWTEKIAPAMQANYYWKQENQNLSEIGDKDLQKEAHHTPIPKRSKNFQYQGNAW